MNYTCPHCHSAIDETEVLAIAGRINNARRKVFGYGPGRPRAEDRCPCGRFTKDTAEKRGHQCVAMPVAKKPRAKKAAKAAVRHRKA